MSDRLVYESEIIKNLEQLKCNTGVIFGRKDRIRNESIERCILAVKRSPTADVEIVWPEICRECFWFRRDENGNDANYCDAQEIVKFDRGICSVKRRKLKG